MMLDAALAYARMGWPVFPVAADCRQPLIEGGCHAASKDEALVRRRWGRSANIALATGNPSGVFALDVDVKGVDGLETLAALEDQHGSLPGTWESETPSGGRHLFFRQPEIEMRNRVAFAPGLDLRTTGGSVALPPSRKSNGAYRWRVAPESCPVAEAPAWLLAMVAPPPPPRRTFRPMSLPTSGRYAEVALAGECREVALTKSGRNQRLFQAAARLAELSAGGLLNVEAIESALEEAAFACGLHTDDGGVPGIRATIASGIRRGLANPRGPSAITPEMRALLQRQRDAA